VRLSVLEMHGAYLGALLGTLPANGCTPSSLSNVLTEPPSPLTCAPEGMEWDVACSDLEAVTHYHEFGI